MQRSEEFLKLMHLLHRSFTAGFAIIVRLFKELVSAKAFGSKISEN